MQKHKISAYIINILGYNLIITTNVFVLFRACPQGSGYPFQSFFVLFSVIELVEMPKMQKRISTSIPNAQNAVINKI